MREIKFNWTNKVLRLPERGEAKSQAEKWHRYTEDFIRRFIDPIHEKLPGHFFEGFIVSLIYIATTCLLIFMHVQIATGAWNK